MHIAQLIQFTDLIISVLGVFVFSSWSLWYRETDPGKRKLRSYASPRNMFLFSYHKLGLSCFCFAWPVARVLLGRICQADVKPSADGQWRRQFVFLRGGWTWTFLFSEVSAQSFRGSHLRGWRNTFLRKAVGWFFSLLLDGLAWTLFVSMNHLPWCSRHSCKIFRRFQGIVAPSDLFSIGLTHGILSIVSMCPLSGGRVQCQCWKGIVNKLLFGLGASLNYD